MHWTEPGGLCLDVPDGWVGLDRANDVLLTLDHQATGVRAEVFHGGPRTSREGFVRIFDDAGTYRAVPLLFPAGTVTWIHADPDGPTVQEWFGKVDGREIRVEVTFPLGGVIRGRRAVEPLLQGLCHQRTR